MSIKSVLRLGGWCALLSTLLTASGYVVLWVAPTSRVVDILSILSILLLVPVFYALSVAHRSESAVLSLAGLVLWIPTGILGIASTLLPDNLSLSAMNDLLSSALLLIFGFLAYRSVKMPRGLAFMVLSGGVLNLISAAGWFIGSMAIRAWAALGIFAFVSAWLVWLWRVFSSGRLDPQRVSTPRKSPALKPSPPPPGRR